MYRGINTKGLNTLSNGISSASDLPPLNPTSGTVYQPPNSTGARNAMIETQRMRTMIMGQIQAIQSEQERKIQQSETRLSMVLRELTPKIQNLDRHNAFNQQQLEDIIERLSQLDCVVIPSIQQKCDEVHLKFEQSIRTETQSKFNPISDDIKHEQSRSEQLSDSATNHISNINDKLNELSRVYDELEKQVFESQNYVQNHIININPHITKIETKLVAYETAAENSIRLQKAQAEYQLSAKKLRKDLEELENDGIPLAIKSAASDTLANITSYTSQIDQKIANTNLLITNMDDAIKMTTEQQKNVDSQVEALSKLTIDIQNSMEKKEQDTNNQLEELESSVKEINNEIGQKLHSFQDDNSIDGKRVLERLSDNIKSLQASTKQLLTQLNQDWARFHKDNGEAQKITDSEIDQLQSTLNGELNLLKRLVAAENRSKWCSSRLQVWQKEIEDADRLQLDDDNLIEKLETLEAKLKETEERIAEIDKQEAPKSKKLKKEKYIDRGPAPILSEPGKDTEPLKIPSDLKLTYDDQDTEASIPDLPSIKDIKEQSEANTSSASETKENSKKKKSKKQITPVSSKVKKEEEEDKKEEDNTKKNEEEDGNDKKKNEEEDGNDTEKNEEEDGNDKKKNKKKEKKDKDEKGKEKSDEEKEKDKKDNEEDEEDEEDEEEESPKKKSKGKK